MAVRIDESGQYRDGRATVTVEAEPMDIDADARRIGEEVAAAMAHSIAEGIRACTVPASPGTIRRRKAEGISSTSKWNATGELANSLDVQRRGDEFSVVAPSDRLQDPGMLEALAADVPAVADPLTPKVEAAIDHAASGIVKIGGR